MESLNIAVDSAKKGLLSPIKQSTSDSAVATHTEETKIFEMFDDNDCFGIQDRI
jgi:hypothetical protein